MLKRKFQLATLLWSIGTACRGEDDRIARVTCGPANEKISADFGGPPGEAIGVLNIARLVPGTLLQLVPATLANARGTASTPHLLQTSPEDFLPLQTQGRIGKIVNTRFNIEVGADVRQAAEALHFDLAEYVRDNTALVTIARRKALRDPLGLINADSQAIGILQTAPDTTRFTIVSAVSYGDAVQLRYSQLFRPANTMKLGDYYLHLVYACADVATINSMVQTSKDGATLLFFHVPVKYDALSRRVLMDPRPIDLTAFDLAAAAT